MNGDPPMRIKEGQLRLLIRRELIRESNRRALREQADAAEEFEAAARDMDDDFNFDEEEAAIRASDPGELVLADNIKDYVQVQFGNARDGTPEERQDADRILSTVAVVHINNIAKYRSRDQGIIRTWKETIEDTRGGGYPVSLAALTAPSAPAAPSGEESSAGQQVARGDQIYNYGDNYEYTVKEEMWHTRKKGSQGRWISLAAAKYAPSRGNLDTKFPDAREADESAGAAPVRSGRGRQQARGESSQASYDAGLEEYGLTLNDAVSRWNSNVSSDDWTKAKADASGTFAMGSKGGGGTWRGGTDEGMMFAALQVAGGYAEIDDDSESYKKYVLPGQSIREPKLVAADEMRGGDLKLINWLGDGRYGWNSSDIGDDGQVSTDLLTTDAGTRAAQATTNGAR